MRSVGRACALAAMLGLFGAQDALAAGFQNTTQSATATSMASMGTANPDEPNSNFYNPAMLALRKRWSVYVGDTVLLPSTSFKDPDTGAETKTVAQTFPPPNLHIGVPIGDTGAAVGFGVAFPYGLGIEWPQGWKGEELIISQDLQTINLNPNVAYKLPIEGINLALAVGAQVNLVSIELVRNTRARDDVTVKTQLGGSATSYGVTAGLAFQPNEMLHFGLNFRSGSTVKADDGKAHFEGEEGTAVEGTFKDQTIKAELNLPHMITLGSGVTLLDKKLFIGLDIVYTTWSDNDKISVQFEDPALGQQNLIYNWNDAFAFRLGSQYQINENIKARVGFAYDMTPIPEETLSPSLPGNNRIAASAGVGYTIKGVRADVGYQFVKALEREVSPEVNTNLPGTYNTLAHILAINVGYGFD